MWPQPRTAETGVWFLGLRVNENKIKITEGIERRATFSPKTLNSH